MVFMLITQKPGNCSLFARHFEGSEPIFLHDKKNPVEEVARGVFGTTKRMATECWNDQLGLLGFKNPRD